MKKKTPQHVSLVFFCGKHGTVTRYDPVNLFHDVFSVFPLQIRIFAARVQPHGLVFYVGFAFKQIAHDAHGSPGGPHYNGHVGERVSRSRDDSKNVLVYTIHAVPVESLVVVRVFVTNAPTDHVRGVQKQIIVTGMIRMAVGTDYVMDVARSQAAFFDSVRQSLAVPRCHRVDDDVFRAGDQRARAIGQRAAFGRPTVAHEQHVYFVHASGTVTRTRFKSLKPHCEHRSRQFLTTRDYRY